MGDVRYAKFRVGDLFDVVRGKSLTKADMVDGDICFVGSSASNNGVTARIGNSDNVHDCGRITIASNGSVGEVFYQPEQFVASADVSVLYPKFAMGEFVALYMCTVLRKVGVAFDYAHKWTKERIQKSFVKLPVTLSGEPDWDYMAERIAELEAERIAELEAYLVATGLDDCKLTDEDCEVLGREVETKEFRVGELFEVRTTKSTDRKNVVFDDGGKYEFVGRSKANNCVQGRVSKFGFDANPKGTLSVVQIGDICCTYRNEPWYASQNIFCLKPLVELDELSALYMATCINKALSQFEGGYVSYPTKKSLQQLDCVVPVTSAGTPDWDYMRAYIRAQEKLVMAGVADMTQERIDATKEIVEA